MLWVLAGALLCVWGTACMPRSGRTTASAAPDDAASEEAPARSAGLPEREVPAAAQVARDLAVAAPPARDLVAAAPPVSDLAAAAPSGRDLPPAAPPARDLPPAAPARDEGPPELAPPAVDDLPPPLPLSVDFQAGIRPILEKRCQPCHFEGGRLYETLPFDRPQTIRDLGSRLFTRIHDPEERTLIRTFLAQPTEPERSPPAPGAAVQGR